MALTCVRFAEPADGGPAASDRSRRRGDATPSRGRNGDTWLFSSQSIGGYVRIGNSVLAVVELIVLASGRPDIGSDHLLRWSGYPVRSGAGSIRRTFDQALVRSVPADGHAGAQSGSMSGLIHRSIQSSGANSPPGMAGVTPGSTAAGQASSAANAAPSAVSSGTARSTVSGDIRPAGPDTDNARWARTPGTATATQRTPSSCSPSSIA